MGSRKRSKGSNTAHVSRIPYVQSKYCGQGFRIFQFRVQDLQYTDYSLHFQSGGLEVVVYGFKTSIVHGLGLRVHGLRGLELQILEFRVQGSEFVALRVAQFMVQGISDHFEVCDTYLHGEEGQVGALHLYRGATCQVLEGRKKGRKKFISHQLQFSIERNVLVGAISEGGTMG